MWLPQDLSETVVVKMLNPTLRKQNLLQWSLETWLPLLTQWSSNCGLQTQGLPQLEAARNAGSRALGGVMPMLVHLLGVGSPGYQDCLLGVMEDRCHPVFLLNSAASCSAMHSVVILALTVNPRLPKSSC